MPTTGAKTPAVEAILHALRQHPNATAAELADHAGIGRSTANKALANLAAEGRATRQRGGRVNGRIIPDRWSLDSDEPTPQASGTSDHGEAEATTTRPRRYMMAPQPSNPAASAKAS